MIGSHDWDRAAICGRLQFFSWCTARRAVPVGGSIDLEIILLCNVKDGEDSNIKAHACFNQLELPPFSSATKLREKLVEALLNDTATDGRFDDK